jgi:hypothetical protein
MSKQLMADLSPKLTTEAERELETIEKRIKEIEPTYQELLRRKEILEVLLGRSEGGTFSTIAGKRVKLTPKEKLVEPIAAILKDAGKPMKGSKIAEELEARHPEMELGAFRQDIRVWMALKPYPERFEHLPNRTWRLKKSR